MNCFSLTVAGEEKIPLVLVGNKADLLEERKVTLEQIAQSKLQHMNDCPYIETSAMFNRNVVKLFLELFQVTKHTLYFSLSLSPSYFNSFQIRSPLSFQIRSLLSFLFFSSFFTSVPWLFRKKKQQQQKQH